MEAPNNSTVAAEKRHRWREKGWGGGGGGGATENDVTVDLFCNNRGKRTNPKQMRSEGLLEWGFGL